MTDERVTFVVTVALQVPSIPASQDDFNYFRTLIAHQVDLVFHSIRARLNAFIHSRSCVLSTATEPASPPVV